MIEAAILSSRLTSTLQQVRMPYPSGLGADDLRKWRKSKISGVGDLSELPVEDESEEDDDKKHEVFDDCD